MRAACVYVHACIVHVHVCIHVRVQAYDMCVRVIILYACGMCV